jgi:hypothetical protein
MEIQIQIVQVDKQTKTTSGGKPYVALELAFKNLSSGKLESKKLMPFGTTSDAHKVLSGANQGDVFTIVSEKNQQSGYWDWLKATQAPPGTTAETVVNNKATPSPKSTYETPEERAKKQVYIVKQSSLSNAIALLNADGKNTITGGKKYTKEDVFALAQELTDWVFAQETVKQTALIDMPSDFEDVQ